MKLFNIWRNILICHFLMLLLFSYQEKHEHIKPKTIEIELPPLAKVDGNKNITTKIKNEIPKTEKKDIPNIEKKTDTQKKDLNNNTEKKKEKIINKNTEKKIDKPKENKNEISKIEKKDIPNTEKKIDKPKTDSNNNIEKKKEKEEHAYGSEYGIAGSKGKIATDYQGQAFQEAAGRIKQHLLNFINLPSVKNNDTNVVFHIKLNPNGSVINVIKLKSSGNKLIDEVAEQGLLDASPYPMPQDPKIRKEFEDWEITLKPEELIN